MMDDYIEPLRPVDRRKGPQSGLETRYRTEGHFGRFGDLASRKMLMNLDNLFNLLPHCNFATGAG